MAWNQSEIGRQFAPALEVGGVAHRRDQGGWLRGKALRTSAR
jgi:hypothetical protein